MYKTLQLYDEFLNLQLFLPKNGMYLQCFISRHYKSGLYSEPPETSKSASQVGTKKEIYIHTTILYTGRQVCC